MPSSGLDDASSRISLRSRITSATAFIRTSRRAVIRYGFGNIGCSRVLSFPKLIPEPVVPTFVLAPLLAAPLLELPSLIRWLCVSTPLPWPNATVDATTIKTSAKKRMEYFMISIPHLAREQAGDSFEHSLIDHERQAPCRTHAAKGNTYPKLPSRNSASRWLCAKLALVLAAAKSRRRKENR